MTHHSLQSRTLPKSPSSSEPAGHHKRMMQRFTVRYFKSTTGILSQTHTDSTGNQALCTSQENLQDYIAHTLCCIERELQMLLSAPLEYQKGNAARAPMIRIQTDTYLGRCPAGVQLGFIHREATIEKFQHRFFFQLFINQ